MPRLAARRITRLHLDRLVNLEYLLVHRGARGSSFVYELVYDGAGKDGRPFVPGFRLGGGSWRLASL